MAKKRKKKRQGLSVSVMVVCLMLAAAWLCWAIASSTYFGAVVEPMEPRGPARRAAGLQFLLAAFFNFLWNSIRIDALPAVFTNSLRHHPWHFGLLFGLEAAVVGFGLCVKRLEAQLSRPPRPRVVSGPSAAPVVEETPRRRRKPGPPSGRRS